MIVKRMFLFTIAGCQVFFWLKFSKREPYFEVVKVFQIWLSQFDIFLTKKNLTVCDCKKNVSFYNRRLSGFFFWLKFSKREPYFEVVKVFEIWLSQFDIFDQKKNLTACDCKKNVSFYNRRLLGFFFWLKFSKREPYFEVVKVFQIWLSQFDIFDQKKNQTACDCKKNVSNDFLYTIAGCQVFFLVKIFKKRAIF